FLSSLFYLSVFFCSLSVPPPEVVNATDADESVLLPFKTTADLPQHVTVEWTLTEPTERKVHVYKMEWKHIHPKYKSIKEITRHQGNEKDLSLNLEDLHLTDSGIYTCTAYNKDGDILLRQSVIFSVRGECISCLSTPRIPAV
uniref:Ig-like domain-containing protein n=1 Tax=Haplochromis burtoni TaxID=8153 RepID=A0A3Q2W2J5_HAPBU